MYELVHSPVEDSLGQLLAEAQETLFVAVPFVKVYGVDMLRRSVRHGVSIKFLTNLSFESISGAGFDVGALLGLWDSFDLLVSSLEKLHAKVYIADQKAAFLTSANLTRGGLRENYEYGIVLRDGPVVSAMLADMDAYFRLGNILERETVEALAQDALEIQRLREELAKSSASRELRRVLAQKEEELETTLLRNRVRGRTINAIFAETIRYLLETRGPLSTEELHPFIQDIHPDICDDSIDRVINGQHFGKKWKHLVRNAQQYLKRSGIIVLEGGKWRLVT